MNRWNWALLIIIGLGLWACNPESESTSSTPELTVAEPSTDKFDSLVEANDSPAVEIPSQSKQPQSQVQLPAVEPLDIEGDMVVAGSSTVFPLTKALYQRFVNDGYAGVMKIDALGTEEGFRLFCQEGQSDIVNASRPIKADEIAACAAIGRKPIDFRVGTDALVVVVNLENDFINDVALGDLSKLFTAEKWSDIDSGYPEELIMRFAPGLDSGTLDFFSEAIFNGEIDPILSSANTQFNSNDEALLKSVDQKPYAIAIVDYAFYHKNSDSLKAIAINGIEANVDTVEQNEYPLARPLFIYSDAKIMSDRPQIEAFINFYLTHVNEEIYRVGYLPNSMNILDQEKNKFLEVINSP